MGPFEMVVAIVAIVMIASIIKTKHKAKQGILEDEYGAQRLASDGDAARLRDELKTLKERVAVLERLATDTNGALALDREIEKLR